MVLSFLMSVESFSWLFGVFLFLGGGLCRNHRNRFGVVGARLSWTGHSLSSSLSLPSALSVYVNLCVCMFVSIYLSICLSVCLSVCLSFYITLITS